jgi:hypothetical protein
MDRAIGLFASALLLAFMGCALGSALLQVLAWTRHAKPGAGVSPKAVWRPTADRFDAVGLRQMLLARRLLVVAVVAYLSYGVLLLVMNVLAGKR